MKLAPVRVFLCKHPLRYTRLLSTPPQEESLWISWVSDWNTFYSLIMKCMEGKKKLHEKTRGKLPKSSSDVVFPSKLLH